MIWPNQRLLDLLRIDLPIIQAPMAGLATSAMAAAVAEVGGLGSLGCAVLSADQIRAEPSATAIVKWGRAPSSTEALKQVRHPVLIANGDADVMVSTANSIALFEALPNARLSIFPDASHGGVFQYADTSVDQTRRFLAE
jgi:NAD(P)H-dependent flavin oxidoreductase YrpB (nitropropane dioxygenase family)